MKPIRSTAELRLAIRELEDQDYVNQQFMRKRVAKIADDLKPVNIAKNLFRNFFSGSEVKTNLLHVATGLATSFVVKKFFRKKD